MIENTHHQKFGPALNPSPTPTPLPKMATGLTDNGRRAGREQGEWGNPLGTAHGSILPGVCRGADALLIPLLSAVSQSYPPPPPLL